MTNNKKIRTRYAPSPTGNLHIGGARTALFNYLFAKKNDGDFIVRIEDTDIARNTKEGESSQLNNLKWLGITIDESPLKPNKKYAPYRQSERLELYIKYAQELLEKKLAYYCYCSPEDLEAERAILVEQKLPPRYSGKCLNSTQEEINLKTNKPSIRIHVPKEEKFKWTDIVRGEISIFGKEMGDWVIIKNNGIATYNFAVVVDDYHMDISHVLRGEEHISNTPKQIHLYKTFGWEIPVFGHMTLIVDANGKKLSKRNESIIQFVAQYKNLGYIPKAMLNFLTILGWSPKGEQEIFTHEEICNIFDAKRLSKSPSTFDPNKLEWINSVYIKELSEDKYLELVKPFAEKNYPKIDFSKENNIEILKLYQKEIKVGSDIKEKISLFFNNDNFIEKDAKAFMKENNCLEVVKIFKNEIQDSNWTAEGITATINNVKEKTNAKGKMLFMPIRIASTGMMHGPDLKHTILLLGKEKTISRLNSW